MSKKEEPLQKEIQVVFIDKDFISHWAITFRPPDVERFKAMDFKLFERIWEQYRGNGITAVLKEFPKKWKTYEQYEKEFCKVMTGKTKENEKRMKNGLRLMTKREWVKGIPKFRSKIESSDVRVIVVGKNLKCIKAFKAEDLTSKMAKKIIDNYAL